MAAPSLPPRRGAPPPPAQSYHTPEDVYEGEEEQDHYNLDGFEEGEFDDEAPDDEEYEEPMANHAPPRGSYRDKQVPAPPQGRRPVPLPNSQGAPSTPARRNVPPPPGPGRPPARAVSPPQSDDSESGEEYTEIPDDQQNKFFTNATNNGQRKAAEKEREVRPLPPPPPEQQEEYEVPETDSYPPPPDEEEYSVPDEPVATPKLPPSRALPPPPSGQGGPSRAPPPFSPPRHQPQPQPQQDDVYEETDQDDGGLYEEDIGNGPTEVYEEMDEVTGRVPAPPPVPSASRPPIKQPPLPSRNTATPKQKPPREQGTKIIDLNSVAVRDQRNKLRKGIPEPFNNDRNNNKEQDDEPPQDLSNLSVAQRMALLKKKGGMFGDNAKTSPAPKAQFKPAPRAPAIPVTPAFQPPRQAQPPAPTPAREPPAPRLTPNQQDRSRPLPPPPDNERQSSISGGSGGSGVSSRRASSSSEGGDSGSGTFKPNANRPLPVVPQEQELGGLYSYPWYFGTIERNEAISKVQQSGRDGCFLVRKSQRGGGENPYTLSVYYKGKVWNLHIRKRSDQKFALGTEKPNEASFTTVPEVIDYHVKNVIVLANKDSIGGEVMLKDSPRNPKTR